MYINKDDKEVQLNRGRFDCRNYIYIGDEIEYMSLKGCDDVNQVDRTKAIPYRGSVIAVYENFVVVQCKEIKECANRWHIRKVNGRPLGNEAGYFGCLR